MGNVDSGEQSGVYTCKAKNRAGYVQHSARLEVDNPLKIEKFSSSKIAQVGENVTLFCKQSGKPRSVVTWFAIEDGSRSKQKLRAVPDLNGNLVISDVGPQDSGTYSCMIENGQSKNIDLQVKGPGDFYPPIVISKVQNLYAAKGETKEIVCELGKNDNAWKIEWYFIKDDLITVLESSQDNSIKIEKLNSAFGEKLIINNMQAGNYGKYKCEASNKHGSSSMSEILNLPELRDADSDVLDAPKYLKLV